MKIAFYTLGCKVNQYETQAIGEALAKSGHTVVSRPADADCIVINSCTVTAESDRKTRQAVRRFRKNNPQSIIVLSGCLPQAFPDSETLLLEADIITGNKAPEKIPFLIEEFLKTKKRIVSIAPHTKDECYSTPPVTDFSNRTRAFMKIEDGCDRYCTYCIIPKARGNIRSRSLESIKREAEALSEKGFSEIVLVGINLTSYGKDLGFDICDAVAAAAKPEGIKRIRLGSLEPDHMSDRLLARLKAEPKFCPQFHLALQSGCDKTLKRMNRHYDTAFFKQLVERIRKSFENCSVTTDIMVGFAGETEDDFNKSLDFYKEIGFARGHVFAYSKRQGTFAASYDNQVLKSEKERRAAVMAKAARQCEADFLKSQIGLTEPVLFETYKDGFSEGYTENYARVKLKTDKSLSGQILSVKLLSVENDFILAKKTKP
ncbi:MAG: tRNA (N(6)-L-threonylcarbamoyladenosine(37)-C(2))-methylthiotransferase MtaB [Clostridia bacterium]|nr:tRNA (N(6)-L-threonylcarbamoyladenosine(37)-C(2))-methylthiotransferase MtaB [Clostridia bacterium]